MNEIVSLLDGFHVYHLDNPQHDLQGTLNEALAKVYEQGAVRDAEMVKERLLERERMGTPSSFPTRRWLYSIREAAISPGLRCPCSGWRIVRRFEDGAQAGVILLMLAPKQLPKESLEVLSEISAMLLSLRADRADGAGRRGRDSILFGGRASAFFQSQTIERGRLS
ncbi:Uncharacterised protein [Actinobacillus pleuropneumoniae]|nr:Uncharacterised protein [Actinobacillus pleuropneumoniae]